MAAALSAKREQFCQRYLVHLNATKAAEEAGYSARTAKSIGHELLQVDAVKARIEALLAARSKRNEIEADAVLRELAILLASNVQHFQTDHEAGALVLADGAPESAWRAVSSVKHKVTKRGRGEDQETTHTIEFRLWDKPSAVNMAMKHLGLITEKHQLTLPPGAGVLAVPVPVDAEQWGRMAAAQQAALAERPNTAAPIQP